MPIVLLHVPADSPPKNGRPRRCPHCGSQVLQRWGQVTRNIMDTHKRFTEYFRYRCGDCRRTFRDYPQGVDRSYQTSRLRFLAALACAMGLSCREVVDVFAELGIPLSRMAVWRDGCELAARLGLEEVMTGKHRFAIDRLYLRNLSTKLGVVIAIRLGTGKTVVLGTLDEYNPRVVKAWLEPLVKDTGIQVSVLETAIFNQLDPCSLGEIPALSPG